MNFGLRDEDLAYIVSAIGSFQEVDKAAIFGSRSKGMHKPGSDVDIAIWGEKISFSTVSGLHSKLEEESPMPYFFDIVDYTHLKHEDLRAHIDRVGIIIFERHMKP